MSSVLLTNGFLRKTLAATRDLGRRGISATVADARRPIPSAWSTYCTASRLYPDPTLHPDAFAEWLLRELQTHPYDLFLPMDDDTMDIAIGIQPELSSLANVLLPDPEVYFTLRDKFSASRAAAEFGFLTPETFLPESEEEVAELSQRLHGAWVVKPRAASGSRGLRIVPSGAELPASYALLEREHAQPMIQSYIAPGPRTDICLLLDESQNLLASFAQREVRHFPMPYGPSTLQESVDEPELIERCYGFAKSIGWTGLLELEFMQNPQTGQMFFLEANTRPWNSLHLAIVAGVPFPWLMYEYAVNGKRSKTDDYLLGVRCRNLLPTDTLHFLSNPDRWSVQPPFFSGRAKGGVDDILSLSDPLPTLGFVTALAAFATRKGAIREAFRR